MLRSSFVSSIVLPNTSNLRVSSHTRLRTTLRASGGRSPLEVAQDAQKVYSHDKPVWCQPWTILGTGSAAIGGSLFLLPGIFKYLVGLPLSIGVFAWWWVFLVVYPQSVLED